MNSAKGERIIVALDVSTRKEAEELVVKLKDRVGYFKVGMELFHSCGPEIINMISDLGCRVFLDLKFHDIPNTVAKAVRSAANYGVDMINVHASGGSLMMEKAVSALDDFQKETKKPRPLLIGVTVLTSLDQNMMEEEWGLKRSVGEQVVMWSKLAQKAGLDGVVASPQELGLIQKACGLDFVTVIPGVRPTWAKRDDQKRIMTPKEAVKAGASFLVIGRPITRDKDPEAAAQRIADEIEGA